jgi:ketosteroid isomerase-like protein
MSRHYIIAILLLLRADSITADPTSATPLDGEQSKVVDAVKSMYVALTNDDFAKFHTVAAPDFYAFDGGERFDGDALMELIKAAHAGGKMYVWRVTEPEVHIEGDVAWVTYVNQGSIEDASGTKPMQWLESAVLRKEKGNWRIQFFHSTRMPSHEK